jgi:3-methyl-2-oxobutanoate hydroxymethyltransferase
VSTRSKVNPTTLKGKKRRGQKITLLTAYDFPMASFIDQAGIDVILVSDAVGTVGNGRTEAVSVTVDEMIYHTRAVRNGVHLEGTQQAGILVQAIVAAGIPVLGHIGVTKQKIVQSGLVRLPGRTSDSAREIINDALEMADSGVFALILECLPVRLAEIITRSLDVPTISIGSGISCDGQGLVTQDTLGLYKEVSPRFLKRYADLSRTIVAAMTEFRQEVEDGLFPTMEHSYTIEDDELNELIIQLQA